MASPDLVGLRGLTPVLQQRDGTCGAAAVATCLRFFGLSSNEYQSAAAMGVSPVVGVAAGDILRYFSHRELYATAWKNYTVRRIIERVTAGRLTLIDLADVGGHWVIACGYDPASDALVFADPSRASPFLAMTVAGFTSAWTTAPVDPGDKRVRQVAIEVGRPSKSKNVRPRHKATYVDRKSFRIADWMCPTLVKRRARDV